MKNVPDEPWLTISHPLFAVIKFQFDFVITYVDCINNKRKISNRVYSYLSRPPQRLCAAAASAWCSGWVRVESAWSSTKAAWRIYPCVTFSAASATLSDY